MESLGIDPDCRQLKYYLYGKGAGATQTKINVAGEAEVNSIV